MNEIIGQTIGKVKSNNLITIAHVVVNNEYHKFESKPYDASEINSLQEAAGKLGEDILAELDRLMRSSKDHYITITTTSSFLVIVGGETFLNTREIV